MLFEWTTDIFRKNKGSINTFEFMITHDTVICNCAAFSSLSKQLKQLGNFLNTYLVHVSPVYLSIFI